MRETIFFSFMVLLIAAITFTIKKQVSRDSTTKKADSIMTLAKNVFQPLPTEAVNSDNPVTPEKVMSIE